MKIKALTSDGGMIPGQEYEVSKETAEILIKVERAIEPEKYASYVAAKEAKMLAEKALKSEADGDLKQPLAKKSKKEQPE